MSELPDARRMLEEAEGAAGAGDLGLADERLRSAARIQEAELGPLHPDLANTLNNLAVVAEQAGRLSDAETFYRRAVAITSASLPPDDPMVIASRANLEDFCFARGLPVAMPSAAAPAPKPTPEPKPIAKQAAPAPPPPARVVDRRPPPAPVAPQLPAETLPPPSRSFAWVGIGIIVLAAVALFVTRPWSSSRETPAPVTAPAPQPAAVAEPAPAAPPAERPQSARAEPVPEPAPSVEPARPPAVVPQTDPRPVPADKPPAQAVSGPVTLATAQLCQTFSPSGANWQCDPVADTVTPRQIVLYTRVRSAGDTTIMHRWYHDGALQQSKTLTITANQTEGYRTYSRQSVDSGDWRVEVRNEKGDLLHEQRFAVR